MKGRYKKIYKKNGVYCEDICDEINAKKENEAFKKVKLKKGEFGLYKHKKRGEEQEEQSKEVAGDMRGIWGIIGVILVLLVVMVYIYEKWF